MPANKSHYLTWLLLVLAPLPGLVVGQEKEAGPATSRLVAVQEGKLPIILSAPHGGDQPIPGVPERKGEGLAKGPSGFFTGRDVGTEQLCYEIARAIEARMGRKPYFVAAKFHRKFIDPNRPAEIAYEHPMAKPVYDVYHDTLTQYCRQVQKQHGRGLLLDIHGQVSAKDTVFRGTKNGTTVSLLIQRFGDKAHNGPRSFFGLMDAQKMKVFPPTAARSEPLHRRLHRQFLWQPQGLRHRRHSARIRQRLPGQGQAERYGGQAGQSCGRIRSPVHS